MGESPPALGLPPAACPQPPRPLSCPIGAAGLHWQVRSRCRPQPDTLNSSAHGMTGRGLGPQHLRGCVFCPQRELSQCSLSCIDCPWLEPSTVVGLAKLR